ncbi:MAG TPA: HAMP domain-containing sensor histidine kinase [Candidatus Limnocylindrales bacterium]
MRPEPGAAAAIDGPGPRPEDATVREPTADLPAEAAPGPARMAAVGPPLTTATSRGVAAEGEDARLLRWTRLRLMAWSGGGTLVVLLLLGAALYAAVAGSLAADGRASIERRADTIGRFLAGGRGPGNGFGFGGDRLPLGVAFGGESAGTLAVLVGPNGQMFRPADAVLPAGLPDTNAIAVAAAGHEDVRDATAGTVPVRILTRPVTRPEGTYVIQIVGDRTAEVNLLRTLLLVLLGGGLLALLAALAAGYLYAGRALVPIRQSIGRRQEALRRQREFTANASHELRTPLTVIRASVADLRRNRRSRVEDVGEALGDIDAEVGHLTALVDDLLLLARTDSGAVELERVDLDLADVAAEGAGALTPLAAERGVSLLVDPRPTPLVGDPLRLRQLVTILADNALRHAPPGTSVVVRVRPDEPGPVLQVDDDGPGIREADLPHVFERFWRADDAPAGGTGLGLSIAAWIVERHGGTIAAANRPTGGARFEVHLPVR